jgi:hypothetical protein
VQGVGLFSVFVLTVTLTDTLAIHDTPAHTEANQHEYPAGSVRYVHLHRRVDRPCGPPGIRSNMRQPAHFESSFGIAYTVVFVVTAFVGVVGYLAFGSTAKFS